MKLHREVAIPIPVKVTTEAGEIIAKAVEEKPAKAAKPVAEAAPTEEAAAESAEA